MRDNSQSDAAINAVRLECRHCGALYHPYAPCKCDKQESEWKAEVRARAERALEQRRRARGY